MSITQFNIKNLREIHSLISNLDDAFYAEPIAVLSGASVGAHVRHILEFYVCLFREKDEVICYDERDRNHKIETDRTFALAIIQQIILKLDVITDDRAITLKANYAKEGSFPLNLHSSLYRELAYCLDHSIHHQALIKVAIKFYNKSISMDENFGVAPSTIRNTATVNN